MNANLPLASTTPSLTDHFERRVFGKPREEPLDLSSAIVRLPPPPTVRSILRSRSLGASMCHRLGELAVELPLRLATQLNKFFNREIGPRNVLITKGVRDGLRRLIDTHTTCDRGVITLHPCYPGYHEVFREKGIQTKSLSLGLGGTRDRIPLEEIKRAFNRPIEPQVRSAGVARGPRAIIVTTPNTPTNSFPDDGDLKKLISLCDTQSKLLIVDNTFDTFDLTEPWSPPRLALNSSIVIGSISEAYSLAQLDVSLGYIVGQEDLIGRLRSHAYSNGLVPSPIVSACAYLTIFEADTYLDDRNDELRARHAIAARLKEIPAVRSVSGQAGTTKWLRFESAQRASEALGRLTLKGITVKTGAEYGTPEALRISLVSQPYRDQFTSAISKVIETLR